MKTRCFSCMEEMTPRQRKCPHCGYKKGTEPKKPFFLVPGTELSNRYMIGEVIDSTDFDISYIGWDDSEEMKVEIKEYFPEGFCSREHEGSRVLIPGGEKSKKFRKGLVDFMTEATVLSECEDAEGIYGVLNYFTENNTAYTVLEYLNGETLASFMDREGVLPEDYSVKLLTPVMKSLSEVHERGLIHESISPEKVFLTTDGDVKLIFTGEGSLSAGSETEGPVMDNSEPVGSGYLPGEEKKFGIDAKPSYDIYSLGAILYKMITGRTAPDGVERLSIFNKGGRDILMPPNKINSEVSEWMSDAVMKAMSINPEERPQRIREFLEEINPEYAAEMIALEAAKAHQPAEEEAGFDQSEEAVFDQSEEAVRLDQSNETAGLAEDVAANEAGEDETSAVVNARVGAAAGAMAGAAADTQAGASENSASVGSAGSSKNSARVGSAGSKVPAMNLAGGIYASTSGGSGTSRSGASHSTPSYGRSYSGSKSGGIPRWIKFLLPAILVVALFFLGLKSIPKFFGQEPKNETPVAPAPTEETKTEPEEKPEEPKEEEKEELKVVTVPELINLEKADAENALKEVGLKYVIEETDQGNGEPRRVLEQDPSPGTEMLTGDTVKLKVKSENIEVPALVGKTQDDAIEILIGAGFNPDTIYVQESSGGSSVYRTVLETNPKEGSVIGFDSGITLTVSAGSKVAAITDIEASSAMAEDSYGNTYYSYNLTDGLPYTCWTEGTGSDGIGEYVDIYFDTAKVYAINVANGYQKTDSVGGGDLFAMNNRVKDAELAFSDGSVFNVTFSDSYGVQRIDLPKTVEASSVRITIKSVYTGTMVDWHDTCISDVEILTIG